MRRTGLIAALLLPVLAIPALAACGKKDNGDGVASVTGNKASASAQPKSTLDRQELARKFMQCMKEHGVEVHVAIAGGAEDGGGPVSVGGSTGPNPDATPPDAETIKKAQEACKEFQPDGGDMPKPSAEEVEQMRKYAKCMRDNGVDMPDPDDDGRVTVEISDGPGQGVAGIDPGSDTFKKANAKCESLQPSPRVKDDNG
jgi:hypothetical protein